FAARLKTYATGSPGLADNFGRAEGDLVSQRDAEKPETWRLRLTGEGSLTAQSPAVRFDSVWHGVRVSWIDHETRVYYEQPTAVRGVSSTPLRVSDSLRLAAAQVASASPFADAFAASEMGFEGHGVADGVECGVVTFTDKMGRQRWHFALNDGLPRRAELIAGGAGMSVSIITEFGSPTTDPSAVAGESWTIVAPEGYARRVSPGPEDVRPAVPRPGPNAVPQVRISPEWELKSSEGKSVSPGVLRDKVTVLYFWGTWCIPCKRVAPLLIDLHRDYEGKGVEIVGMACRERDAAAAVRHAAEVGYNWPQIVGADEVAKLYEVRFYPAFIVLGKASEIVYESGRPENGSFDGIFEEMRKAIDAALVGQVPGRGAAGSVGASTRASEGSPLRILPRPTGEDDRPD
ncbi:MAG: TlpA family protein disulfide reductase, partial [Phycisphaeraceae bacterium]|nr:TlpA family protein disulfide reductase [Phycisphaeraceae bacterium]